MPSTPLGSAHAGATRTSMPIPRPRGPVSNSLISVLLDPSPDMTALTRCVRDLVDNQTSVRSLLFDEDAQLTLTLLYELHLQGIAGVSDRWEWDIELLTVRRTLEVCFESALRNLADAPTSSGDVAADLWK